MSCQRCHKLLCECPMSFPRIVAPSVPTLGDGYDKGVPSALPDPGYERAVDPVVEANRRLLLERSKFGLKKYGRGLGNPLYLTRRQALQHALEEALDLANYLQAEMMRIDVEEGKLEEAPEGESGDPATTV